VEPSVRPAHGSGSRFLQPRDILVPGPSSACSTPGFHCSRSAPPSTICMTAARRTSPGSP
jgi:hypothetical protein